MMSLLFIVRNWRNKKGWKLAKKSCLTIVFNTFLGFVIILESFKGWFCLKNWHFSLENNRCTFLKIDFREIKLVFLYFKSIFLFKTACTVNVRFQRYIMAIWFIDEILQSIIFRGENSKRWDNKVHISNLPYGSILDSFVLHIFTFIRQLQQ